MKIEPDKDVTRHYIPAMDARGRMRMERDPQFLRADILMLLHKHGAITRTRLSILLGTNRHIAGDAVRELEECGEVETYIARNPLRSRADEFLCLPGFRAATIGPGFRAAETLAAFQSAARVAYGMA